MRKRLLTGLATALALTLAPAALAGPASASTPEPTPVPLLTAENAIPGKYIVTLDAGVDGAKLAEQLKLKPSFVYSKAVNGFAVAMTTSQLAAVRLAPGVKSVEEDAEVSAPLQPAAGPALRAPAAAWGLDRIDQRSLPLDGTYTPTGSGAGVTAYIIDSGIDYQHTEFGGRAVFGFDAMGDGRQGLDCNGHGTHVAGTVAGKTYGVATKANLVSVRVLGCDGRGAWSGIIAGFDWVAKNARQPAVANASLGGDRSTTVNAAATALSDAGVLPVVAAGNEARDACNVSPASAARVLTVGASNAYDQETDFSNYGPCVNLYAPGQDVVSARLGGGTVALNGTSMASPHVAGIAVLHRQAHPTETPAQIYTYLKQNATKGVLTRVSTGSPNELLFASGL
ncbi:MULTISPECIES: S8 family peptidase [Streptomyces]|nr:MULTISPECIES: S8 family peptidase [Streptomyces]